jgi:hypothetical protein
MNTIIETFYGGKSVLIMILICVFYEKKSSIRLNTYYVVCRFGSPTDAKLGGGRLAHTGVTLLE